MIDLIGHTLNAVAYNDEDKTLSITLDGDKIFLIKVEGDCCSVGKFISATDGWRLDLPSKIVELKERKEHFDAGSDSSYQVYEDTYVLENGKTFTILYDNMSNGYYGSSLQAYYDGKLVWKFPQAVGGKP